MVFSSIKYYAIAAAKVRERLANLLSDHYLSVSIAQGGCRLYGIYIN